VNGFDESMIIVVVSIMIEML